VPLNREIEYLQHFINLQLLRISNKQVVDLQIGVISDKILIAPMLLIPFVENAFKHVSEKKMAAAISISIKTDDKKIHFSCKNKFNENDLLSKDKVGGIGLNNVKRRLELLYADRHLLHINKDGSFYDVSLTLSTDVSQLHNY
jgi:LytS/YehU family sensor histidine kinase